MFTVYNKFSDVANGFRNYFSNFTSHKTLLNFCPEFFCSIIDAESITTSKVTISLFENFNNSVHLDSISKRIYRCLHNPTFLY